MRKTVWTPQLVREALPIVQIVDRGQRIHGVIKGRLNPVATVYWGSHGCAEYAWETIADALNHGRPLRAE